MNGPVRARPPTRTEMPFALSNSALCTGTISMPAAAYAGSSSAARTASARKPVTTTTLVTPAAPSVKIVRLISGIPPTTCSGLGRSSPSARRRVPLPAARMTACRIIETLLLGLVGNGQRNDRQRRGGPRCRRRVDLLGLLRPHPLDGLAGRHQHQAGRGI